MRLALLLFLAAWPLAAAVPTPRSHFGHDIDADRNLLDWEKVVAYFRALEANSQRIKIEELGQTTGGRPMIAAFIASPDTLQALNRYKDILTRLSDPRLLPEPQAETLIAQGKPVVMITCSIHSTEVASTHTAVEFAYRLLTQEKPRLRAILDNVIFILVPSLNPDGVDIVTQWYRRTLGTPHEGTSPPQLYHLYTGHDNNRDWYMFTQKETRLVVGKLHNPWRPQIVYDVHQQAPTGPRIFVPPWLDPIEPNVDPILVQEMNHIGTGMALDLTAAGKTGVAVHSGYDFWTPARHYQAFHGGLRILTESASARLATPVTIGREQLRSGLGFDALERAWNHPEPWSGGEWRLKDIMDYQLIAWESCLYQAALRRDDLLRNFYRIQQRQIDRKTPFAFLIPASQNDPGATRRLVETLAFGMVEVEIEQNGSHRVRMAQPYSGFAKALLERQRYPDLRVYPGGPPRRPYDVTAHTLPLLMGVAAHEITRPLDTAAVAPVVTPRRGVLAASDTDSWPAINEVWKKGGQVWRDAKIGDFSATNLGPGWRLVPRPRVGLYKSFMPSMDEGWTRWIFDQMGFQYSSPGNREIQAGGLRQQFDVILFPDQPASSIAEGYTSGSMPDEYVGGLGDKGAAALLEFAEAGGTLIFLNRSCDYATQRLGVRAKNVLRGVSNRDFYCPGSLLNAQLDTSHPLAYGLPADITIWAEGSPAWATEEISVVSYPEKNLLASGWLLGEKLIARHTALVEMRTGRGRILLFGMRPQYRGQSYLTMKLLFNALLLGER